MADCPRAMSRADIERGLRAGRTLVVDRKDAPELEDLRALQREGKVTSELVQFDEQSSGLRWRWAA